LTLNVVIQLNKNKHKKIVLLMVSLYIEHVTNWKKTRLGIPKFSLFDINRSKQCVFRFTLIFS